MKKNKLSLAAFAIAFLLTACSDGVQGESSTAVNTSEAASETAKTVEAEPAATQEDRKSTRLNSSHA